MKVKLFRLLCYFVMKRQKRLRKNVDNRAETLTKQIVLLGKGKPSNIDKAISKLNYAIKCSYECNERIEMMDLMAKIEIEKWEHH